MPKKRIALIVLQVLFVFVLLLTNGCGTSILNSAQTYTPSPSATATCAPDIQLSTPEGWDPSSRLIVILFDPRAIGNQQIELSNGERTKDISLFIERIIPVVMHPGDQVSVFQLGYESYEAARVARLYSYASIPQLYNTPSPRETLTPLPSTPTTPLPPGFQAVAATKFARSQLSTRAAVETANASIYNCETIYWNNNVGLTATAWNGIATAEIGSVNNQLNEDTENFAKKTIETPFSTDELYYGGLYYGLAHASTDIVADCENYDRCILIIIDDLSISGKNNPDRLQIDLTGVNIYVIMPNCRDINQPKCASLQDYWNDEFKKFGASKFGTGNAEFAEYMNGIRVELNLLNAIGR
jgi:hypothetical protein